MEKLKIKSEIISLEEQVKILERAKIEVLENEGGFVIQFRILSV